MVAGAIALVAYLTIFAWKVMLPIDAVAILVVLYLRYSQGSESL